MRERLSRFSSDNDLVYIVIFSILWENGELPLHVGKGQLIFHDYGHYTPAGAKYVAEKFVRRFPRTDHLFSGPISRNPSLNSTKPRTAVPPALSKLRRLRRKAKKSRLSLIIADNCHQEAQTPHEEFEHCLSLDTEKPNILVIGSSYGAGDWLMLQSAYPEANVKKLTVAGCTPTYKVKAGHCSVVYRFLNSNFDKVNRFDLVIISRDWVDRYDKVRLDRLLKKFNEAVNVPIVIFGPRGKLSADSFEILRRKNGDTVLKLDDSYTEPSELYNRKSIQTYAEQNGMKYIDMYNILREDELLPILVTKDQLIYLDHGHYTPAGAEYIAQKFREIYPDVTDIIKRD